MLPDLLYLSRKSQKPKMSTKVRGNLVTAVGWSHSNESEASTGPILMGSTRGLIFETDLDSGEDRLFTTSLEQYWKQIFDLGRGQHVPITGLEYHAIPRSKKYFILATTPIRLYQFCGNAGDPADRPLLQQVRRRKLITVTICCLQLERGQLFASSCKGNFQPQCHIQKLLRFGDVTH